MSVTTLITPADALRKSFKGPRGWGLWPMIVQLTDGFLAKVHVIPNGHDEDVLIRLSVRGNALTAHGELPTTDINVLFVDGELRSFEVRHAADWVDFARQLKGYSQHPAITALADMLDQVGRGEDLRHLQYFDE